VTSVDGDVVGDVVGDAVGGSRVYVEDPITTTLGQVRDATFETVVEG
jgi:hypothetical protein